MKINFYFTNKTSYKIPKRYFLFALQKLIEDLKIQNPLEVSLILVTPKEIQKLNKKYRNKDKVTDVLSFPIDIEQQRDIKKFNKNDIIILGDIYLCPYFIKKNNPSNFQSELQFVFLHGLMHLLGYGHKEQKGLNHPN